MSTAPDRKSPWGSTVNASPALDILRETFGYPAFRGAQAEIGFLFFRLVSPITMTLVSLLYVFVLMRNDWSFGTRFIKHPKMLNASPHTSYLFKLLKSSPRDKGWGKDFQL